MPTCTKDGCDKEARPRKDNRGTAPTRCVRHGPRTVQTPKRSKCKACGITYVPLRAKQQYHAPECKRIDALKPPLDLRECELIECGATYRPIHRWQRGCTRQHGAMIYNRESRADGRQQPSPWNDRRRDNYHRRRALRKGASTGQPVRLTDIATRDHWTCGICKHKVKQTDIHPHPMSPSLDHVLPLSQGGAHDPSNVRLTHLRCNVRRSNRYDGEAVMLFG